MKKKIIISLIAFVILLALIIIPLIYLNSNQYIANDQAKSYTHTSPTTSTIDTSNPSYTFYESSYDANTALVFYPGAKVESASYSYLGYYLNQHAIDVYLVNFPWNIAMFDINRAESIIISQPEIENWYISGHSLGGVAAIEYAKSGPSKDKINGVILLASYPADSEYQTLNIPTLTIVGNLDSIISQDAYTNSEIWPQNTTRVTIYGGNHGQMGNYGHQEGDSDPTITPLNNKSK